MTLLRTLLLFLLLSPLCQAERLTFSCRSVNALPGDVTYFWFPHGDGKQPTVPSGWSAFLPGLKNEGGWDWSWACGIRIPASAKPGQYDVGIGKVTVVAPPQPREFIRLETGDSAALCQKLVDRGWSIEFAPGLHTWDRAVHVPPNVVMRGYGAKIHRRSNGDYAERIFVPYGAFALEGLDIEWDRSITIYEMLCIHNFPRDHALTAPHVTVRDVTLRNGSLGRSTEANMLVERCRLIRAQSGMISFGSVWRTCEFLGPTQQGEHAWFCTGTDKGALVADCRWDGCTRGMVLQNGRIIGVVAVQNYFRSIRGMHNAGEVILLETAPGVGPDEGMSDNAFVGVHIHDCSGPGISLFGSGMRRTILWDVDAMVDNTGLSLIALDDRSSIDETQVWNFQSTGGVVLSGNVGKIECWNMQLIETAQLRGNQGPFAPWMEHVNKTWPFRIDEVAKKKADVRFVTSGILDGRKYRELKSLKSGTGYSMQP